jgi:hypothetical protein
MAGWKELLIDILKLTDEVKRMNTSIERLERQALDTNSRLVRLETLVEVAKAQQPTIDPKKLN